jgi:hypothetical protein
MKNYCADCRKKITRYAKRCHRCASLGKNNPFYGKCHSNKTKRKKSIAMTGDKNPAKRPEVREKIKKAKEGKKRKPFSKECKRNMSKSHMGISSWNKNIPCPEEKKRKLSKKLKGRKDPLYNTPQFIYQSLQNSHGNKCYYDNEFFPSNAERDCYIELKKLGFKIEHNFLNRFDFLILINNKKVVVEFHPFDFKLTDKQYYIKRRKLLDEYGHKDLKLIVIKNIKDIKILEKYERN